MGRIKHPDTFTCDICGRDLDAQESGHVWPVLTFCDEVADENGIHHAEETRYNWSELYLCRECRMSLTVVRRRPVFYGESIYELAERGKNDVRLLR